MRDLGGEGVGSRASSLQVATMCRGDAGPLVRQTSIGLWMQHSLGTVWHLWGSCKENLRERASVVTAGGSDCFGVSLLLKAGTIDSGRKGVVKSKGEKGRIWKKTSSW